MLLYVLYTFVRNHRALIFTRDTLDRTKLLNAVCREWLSQCVTVVISSQ